MGYQQDWAEITSDPAWSGLPDTKKREYARQFARLMVKPEDPKAVRSFIEQNVVIPMQTAQGNRELDSKGNAKPFVGAAGDFGASFMAGAANSLPTQAAFYAANQARKIPAVGDLIGHRPLTGQDFNYEPQTLAGNAGAFAGTMATEGVLPGGAALKGARIGAPAAEAALGAIEPTIRMQLARSGLSAGGAGLLSGAAREAMSTINRADARDAAIQSGDADRANANDVGSGNDIAHRIGVSSLVEGGVGMVAAPLLHGGAMLVGNGIKAARKGLADLASARSAKAPAASTPASPLGLPMPQAEADRLAALQARGLTPQQIIRLSGDERQAPIVGRNSSTPIDGRVPTVMHMGDGSVPVTPEAPPSALVPYGPTSVLDPVSFYGDSPLAQVASYINAAIGGRDRTMAISAARFLSKDAHGVIVPEDIQMHAMRLEQAFPGVLAEATRPNRLALPETTAIHLGPNGVPPQKPDALTGVFPRTETPSQPVAAQSAQVLPIDAPRVAGLLPEHSVITMGPDGAPVQRIAPDAMTGVFPRPEAPPVAPAPVAPQQIGTPGLAGLLPESTGPRAPGVVTPAQPIQAAQYGGQQAMHGVGGQIGWDQGYRPAPVGQRTPPVEATVPLPAPARPGTTPSQMGQMAQQAPYASLKEFYEAQIAAQKAAVRAERAKKRAAQGGTANAAANPQQGAVSASNAAPLVDGSAPAPQPKANVTRDALYEAAKSGDENAMREMVLGGRDADLLRILYNERVPDSVAESIMNAHNTHYRGAGVTPTQAGIYANVAFRRAKAANAWVTEKGNEAFDNLAHSRFGVTIKDGVVHVGERVKEMVAKAWEQAVNLADEKGIDLQAAYDGVVRKFQEWFTSNGGRPEAWGKIRDAFYEGRQRDYAAFRPVLREIEALPAEKRIALHDQYTGDTPETGEFSSIIEQVRKLNMPLSDEMAKLGFVTKDARESTRVGGGDRFLNRKYAMHQQLPVIGKARQYRIAEDVTKGVGKTQEVSPERWAEIQAERQNHQWEKVGGNRKSTVLRDETGRQIKLSNDEADLFLNDYQAINGGKGGMQKVWRDYTNAERTSWGQDRDAHAVIKRTASKLIESVRSGQLFDKVAANKDLALSKEAFDNLPTAEQARLRAEGWTDLSADKISKSTARVAKWGALSGHYVHPAVARDLKNLTGIDKSVIAKGIDAVNDWLRRAQVSMNPASWGNEIISNTALYQMLHKGGNVAYVADGFNEMRQGAASEWFRKAEAAGLFESDYTAGDVQAQLHNLPVIGKGTPKQVMDGVASFLKNATTNGKRGVAAMQAMDAAKLPFRATEHFYRKYANDAFRLAHFIDFMENDGMSPEEAARAVKDVFYSHPSFAPAVQTLRRYWNPYIGYKVWILKKTAEAARDNPVEALKLLGAVSIFGAINSAIGKHSTSDEEAINESQRTRVLAPGIGPKNLVPLPGDGNYIDAGSYLPNDNLLNPATFLGSAGGATGIAASLVTNQNPFTGKDIRDTSQPWQEQARQFATYAVRSALPNNPLVPYSYSSDRLSKSVRGVQDKYGNAAPLPQAVANTFGIKAKHIDNEAVVDRSFRAIQSRISTHQANIGKMADALARGEISESQYLGRVAEYEKAIEQEYARMGKLADKLK